MQLVRYLTCLFTCAFHWLLLRSRYIDAGSFGMSTPDTVYRDDYEANDG
jgi:hypothetical protein